MTGTILVAADDGAIRTVLNQALSRSGYEVRCTGNAATLTKQMTTMLPTSNNWLHWPGSRMNVFTSFTTIAAW